MATVGLHEIVAALGGELIGEPATRIDRIAALEGATPSTLTFLANPRLRPLLEASQAGCVGVAGSAVIGKHCTVGGAGMILGHLELADHVHISAGSLVTRSIRKPGQYTGVFPIDDNASWEKNAATLRQLHTLRERLRALEKAAPEKNITDSAGP